MPQSYHESPPSTTTPQTSPLPASSQPQHLEDPMAPPSAAALLSSPPSMISRRSAPSFASHSHSSHSSHHSPSPSPHMMAMPPSSPPSSSRVFQQTGGPAVEVAADPPGPSSAPLRDFRGRGSSGSANNNYNSTAARAATPPVPSPSKPPPRRSRSQTPRHTSLFETLPPSPRRTTTIAPLHPRVSMPRSNKAGPLPPSPQPQRQFRSASAQPLRSRSVAAHWTSATRQATPSHQHLPLPVPQQQHHRSSLPSVPSQPPSAATHNRRTLHPRLQDSPDDTEGGGGGSVRSGASGSTSQHSSSLQGAGRRGASASDGGRGGGSGSGSGFRLRKAHSSGGAVVGPSSSGGTTNRRFGSTMDREPPVGKGSGSGVFSSRRNHRRWSEDSLAQHARECRRVLDDLSRAQGSEHRIGVLTHVCECFDHTDEVKHNLELGQGAILVLTKGLQLATFDDEVRMNVSALEMVLRGSSRDVQQAYAVLGSHAANNSAAPLPHHHLLTTLFRILDRCEANAMKLAGVTILNISKILFHLSNCPELRLSLGRQVGVLESLQRVATHLAPTPPSPSRDGANSYSSLHHADVRLYRLRTLANLANVDENKVLLVEHHGGVLVEGLVRVAHWDFDDSCRQCAASALMDLASEPRNQVALARDDTVLGTLIKMTLVETNAATREFAITALQNLAYCKDNRTRLVCFKDGVLLEALQQALASDAEAKARRRAAGALTNLVCDETARRMGEHHGLLEALALVATKDDNWDVQTRASLALTKIANCLTVDMDCHEALLDALVVASLSKAENSVSGVFRFKARNPENRPILARHSGVIDTLADLCLSGGGHGASVKSSDRDNAVRALMHLVNEPDNRLLLCQQPHVLDALVAAANYEDPDLEEARDSAIRALERLATEPSNRATLARHPGLLTAVAAAVEREARWEEEEVREKYKSEHGRFAKPLLMSLLVAM